MSQSAKAVPSLLAILLGLLLAGLAAALTVLTPAAAQRAPTPDEAVGGGLSSFRSEQELRTFLAGLKRRQGRDLAVFDVQEQSGAVPAPPPPPAMAAPTAAEAITVTGSRVANPNITNTQEVGVDEGGIVKVAGDYLVILRRGRLHTVSTADGRLTPVDRIDAYPPGVSGQGDWYDEMLLHGDQVIVVGYSYARGGTEVNRFRIDPAGRLTFVDAHHLRSNDYYSSRNYASRLIGDRLVFYTPLFLNWGGDVLDSFPGVRRWERGRERAAFRRLAGPRQVFIPEALRRSDTARIEAAHSVTSCDLSAPALDCTATVVLGPSGRNFYVSPNAVYLWTSGAWERSRPGPDSFVVRLPLSGDRPSAIQARGAPIDQFSFREDGDVLNVLVRAQGGDDWMFRPEDTTGNIALLRLPLRIFGDGGREARLDRYRPLPLSGQAYNLQNRYVGDHLLYGAGADGFDPNSDEGVSLLPAVHVVPLRGGPVSTLRLPHEVDRLEALGRDALVVGGSTRALGLSTVELPRGARPRLGDRFTLPDAQEGESRSHAFFFSPDASSSDGGSGIMGLPVSRRADPRFARFFGDAASMLFLRREDRRLHDAGELEARPREIRDDGCQASCVDWYGNARPIFLGDRTFALLGYELVEGRLERNRIQGGRLDRGRIREVRRVDFSPRPVRASAR